MFARLYPEFCVTEQSDLDPDKKLLFQSINFVQHSGFFKSFVENEDFQQVLKTLLEDDGALFMEAFHYKQPGGGAFEAHQDLQSPVLKWVNDRLPENERISDIITVCVAIDEHTLENGCINVAEGEHVNGLLGPFGYNIAPEVYSKLDFTPTPLGPGDVLFFHGHCPHGSETNMSDKERKSLMLFYNPASEGHHHNKAMAYFYNEEDEKPTQ